jgi:putative DNA primase/helicase
LRQAFQGPALCAEFLLIVLFSFAEPLLLLSDIQSIFDEKKLLKISYQDLLKELLGDDELGWGTFNRGRPMTGRQLTKKLSIYGVVTKTIRIGSEAPKGYTADQFIDVFSRYLPSTPENLVTTVTGSQPSPVLGSPVTDPANVTQSSGRTNLTDTFKPNKHGACDPVTVVTSNLEGVKVTTKKVVFE